MTTSELVLLPASALFAWSMGSHYTGSVAGAAYGAGVLSLRASLLLTAGFTMIGAVIGSVRVVDTYATVVPHAPLADVISAQVAASVVTTTSTFFKLPASTIQVYGFSLLGAALVGGAAIDGWAFALIVVGWAVGPVAAFGIGLSLSRLGRGLAGRGEQVLRWFLIAVVIYSGFILGSNDVSNAAASLVNAARFPVRLAALYGGAFMALGVITWGGRMLRRIGHDILPLTVQMGATAQLSKAIALSLANTLGYNASINQTITAGLVGVGLAQQENRLNKKVARTIVLNWVLSPILGLGVAALAALIFRATIK